MHKKVWFLVAAAVALFALSGTAAATGASSPKIVSAKPFSMANTTPHQRAVSHTLNFGMEQDVSGFDSLNANQDQYWAVVTGETPSIRGDYIVDNKGNYHLDLATKVVATKTTLTIYIRNDAYWYWQNHAKAHVTADDYIYTWQQIMDPSNDSASTTGYSNITSATKNSAYKVTFHWSTPFADYQDLFGFILPKAAFKTWDGHGGFNSAWTNCICDHSGNAVSDGPYYLDAYTVGQGVTIKATPSGYWYGHTPALTTVNFKLILDNNTEYQAYNGGEIDAMAPAPNPLLHQYFSKPGTKMSVLPSFTQEHLDINLKGDSDHSNPNGILLGQAWMRQAIMEGIDRVGIIKAVFTGISSGLKPLNNPVWNLGTNANSPNNWMAVWNYNKTKAINTLKAHCHGGPTSASNSNTKVWTCGTHKTQFNFKTTTRATRTTSSAIIKQNLMAIGIKITVTQQDPGTFFGSTTPSKDFDIAEYAWIGGVDPSGFDAIYQCQKPSLNLGGQNYKNYCKAKVDSLIKAGDAQLNATKRIADYQAMAKIVGADVPVIPLYGAPVFLVYRSALFGMGTANNPTQVGPTWNIETWHW
jgi:peptide/nickel transport system substrate-binding protein